jgi:hypothetical protein
MISQCKANVLFLIYIFLQYNIETTDTYASTSVLDNKHTPWILESLVFLKGSVKMTCLIGKSI